MKDERNNNKDTVFFIDDLPVSTAEVVAILRRENMLPTIVKHLVLDKILQNIEIPSDHEKELVQIFRKQNNLIHETDFKNFLKKYHTNETLLKQFLSRPDRVVTYREERWGPRANSLYLKHKDRYDLISYRRLESTNADVMQEVYFRLKDKEDSWESMANQFPNCKSDEGALVKDVPAEQVEEPLLDALRKAGVGELIRPIRLGPNTIVIAELEKIKASKLDEEIRTLILREEFDRWLEDECNRMLKKLEVQS